mmetsp:Transcript_14579/g.21290  ORF Transcript_14579/g.21290 Transcript_14579/m.21290 type:complete len:90 (-) Transcript_14579:792-1061(-)
MLSMLQDILCFSKINFVRETFYAELFPELLPDHSLLAYVHPWATVRSMRCSVSVLSTVCILERNPFLEQQKKPSTKANAENEFPAIFEC